MSSTNLRGREAGPGIGGGALAAPGDLNPTTKPRQPGTTARVGGAGASPRAERELLGRAMRNVTRRRKQVSVADVGFCDGLQKPDS